MVLALSLLCTHNLSVPLSFSEVNDVSIGAAEFLRFSLQAAVSGGFLRAVSSCVKRNKNGKTVPNALQFNTRSDAV